MQKEVLPGEAEMEKSSLSKRKTGTKKENALFAFSIFLAAWETIL